tara:strand:- start:80 stop:466 length:387 start_codon:yes stop_codon:yes gene_type:complete
MPMTQITINEWLSSTPKTTTTGASMPTYSFQPLTKGHRTSDYYLDTWIATMQEDMEHLLFGRIISTGINYIATGYNGHGDWVKIPCANLNTAKLYMGRYMSERLFKRHTWKQAQYARLVDNRYVCHSE